ncbi:hypothetical protein TNCV_894461 [Trichonephila clavipes]|nr:hypothetical protein TNCV_894461 [Trichonephila clavipes]
MCEAGLAFCSVCAKRKELRKLEQAECFDSKHESQPKTLIFVQRMGSKEISVYDLRGYRSKNFSLMVPYISHPLPPIRGPVPVNGLNGAGSPKKH